MPDWISHVLIALIIAELFNIKKKSLLVLGSLLPDFITKVYLLNYFVHLPLVFDTVPFLLHFYLPAVMVGMLTAFILIPLGTILHLTVDFTTRHFFNDEWYKIFWEDEYWKVLVLVVIVYLLIVMLKQRTLQKEFTELRRKNDETKTDIRT